MTRIRVDLGCLSSRKTHVILHGQGVETSTFHVKSYVLDLPVTSGPRYGEPRTRAEVESIVCHRCGKRLKVRLFSRKSAWNLKLLLLGVACTFGVWATLNGYRNFTWFGGANPDDGYQTFAVLVGGAISGVCFFFGLAPWPRYGARLRADASQHRFTKARPVESGSVT